MLYELSEEEINEYEYINFFTILEQFNQGHGNIRFIDLLRLILYREVTVVYKKNKRKKVNNLYISKPDITEIYPEKPPGPNWLSFEEVRAKLDLPSKDLIPLVDFGFIKIDNYYRKTPFFLMRTVEKFSSQYISGYEAYKQLHISEVRLKRIIGSNEKFKFFVVNDRTVFILKRVYLQEIKELLAHETRAGEDERPTYIFPKESELPSEPADKK